MMWAGGQVSYLRADVSHFLCCTRAKEIGDVCTQATDILQTWNLRKSVAIPRPDTVTKGVTGFYLGFTV